MNLSRLNDLLMAMRQEFTALERRAELLCRESDPVSRRLHADAESRIAEIRPMVLKLEDEAAEGD